MTIAGTGLIDPILQFVDGNGVPYASGTVTFYAAGTTTLQDIYSDTGLSVALTNPMTLNAAGRSSSNGTNTSPVYFQPLAYDYTLKDSAGTVIYGPEPFSGSTWPGALQGVVSIAPAANANAYANRVTTTIAKASSGTHALFTGTRFDASSITAGASTLTEAATVYIEGPPTAGSTVYALDVAAGNVHIAGNIVSSGRLTMGVVTLTDGASVALDASLGSEFILTTTTNPTIAVPTNAVNGQRIIIRVKASGGSRTMALTTSAGGFRFGSDITALTATSSGKTDYVGAIYNGTDSFWDVVAYVKGF